MHKGWDECNLQIKKEMDEKTHRSSCAQSGLLTESPRTSSGSWSQRGSPSPLHHFHPVCHPRSGLLERLLACCAAALEMTRTAFHALLWLSLLFFFFFLLLSHHEPPPPFPLLDLSKLNPVRLVLLYSSTRRLQQPPLPPTSSDPPPLLSPLQTTCDC